MGEGENLLAGRSSEESAETAAEEEIVGAGEGRGVGSQRRQVEGGWVVGTQCDDDDSKEE